MVVVSWDFYPKFFLFLCLCLILAPAANALDTRLSNRSFSTSAAQKETIKPGLVEATIDSCQGLVVAQRADASQCVRNLLRAGHIGSFGIAAITETIDLLLALGATDASANWGAYSNYELLVHAHSIENQSLPAMMDSQSCSNSGDGCFDCAWGSGNNIISIQGCYEMCQAVCQVIISYDNPDGSVHIESFLYSYQSC